MNAATCHDEPRRPGRGAYWGALGLLLAIVLGTAVLGRIEPMTWTAASAIAGVGAAGILTMAGLMQRRSLYPRWAWWTTAGVMSGALLLSLALASDPAAWEADMKLGVWMLPWFLLVMGTTRSRTGVCSPGHARPGWIMVGTGLVMSGLLLGANAIADALRGLFTGRLL